MAASDAANVVAGTDFGALAMASTWGGNLVQNPGFEQGLRSWYYLSLGQCGIKQSQVPDFYRISEEGAQEGRRCLEIITEPGVVPVHLATFGIAVEPGKPYVLSFQARADRVGCTLDVASHTAEWPRFDCGGQVKLGTAWSRQVMTFTASNRMIGIGFAPAGNNPAGARLFVDAVQVQAGGEPTAFVRKPVTATLVSADAGNLLEKAAAAALRLDGTPGLAGTVAVTARALDGRERAAQRLPFTLDAAGGCRIDLPWAEGLPRGMTVVETVVEGPDGFRDRDFHRLAIAPRLAERRAHHLLFAGGAMDSRYGAWDRWASFFQRAGIGSHVVFDPAPAGMQQAFAAHGVYLYSAIFDGGENVVLDGRKVELRKDYHQLTPAQLARIEQLCYEKAKANPTIRHWKTFNEMDAGASHILLMMSAERETRMKAFVELHRAAWRGIKRADPALRVMTPDCSTMYPSTGIALIDAFYAAGGTDCTDLAAIHSYRGRPEEPDLDEHLRAFMAVLDRHGYQGDIWFTEGIYHQPWQVPALRLDPHAGCSSDHFRVPTLSYACAWGERIATAYTMRTWLVMLQHADRVKNSVDWGFPRSNRTLDHAFTPSALFFASHTLADLLGDSAFIRRVGYGRGVRCLVFDDRHGGTVAALWSCDAGRDKGVGTAPVLRLPGLPAGCERIAMDGEVLPAAADLAILPEPQFLRSRDRAALLSALDAGTFPAGGVEQVHATLALAAPDRAEASVRNLLDGEQRGRLVVTGAGGQVLCDRDEVLAPGATATVAVPVTVVPGQLAPVSSTIAFTRAGTAPGKPLQTAFDSLPIRRLAAPPAIDGDLGEWPASARVAIPHRLMEYQPLFPAEREAHPAGVPWKGSADLSAELSLGWDAGHLYLGLSVRDDVHDPIEEPSRSWQGDSVQLYLDAWGDARARGLPGYGNDDQAFRLWPRADGSVGALRDTAPEQQVAFLKTGPVPGVRAAVKRGDGVTVYELAFPLREIQPVQLKAGAVLGLALLINDRDRDFRKRALTMTPAGTEPHQHPELFPAAILVE
ncbi:MAG: hypothetical protein L6R48_18210 [Planctomycetes bacterium]|nr:hypothetical protein [Planctomycetota bacterium]